jgi:hypothetical protein
MLMHHVVAAALLAIMVYGNGLSMGCTIAFLHDIADILVAIVKALGQTHYEKLAVFVFIIHMFTWGYTRNYLLPKLMYFVWTEMIGCMTGDYA